MKIVLEVLNKVMLILLARLNELRRFSKAKFRIALARDEAHYEALDKNGGVRRCKWARAPLAELLLQS